MKNRNVKNKYEQKKLNEAAQMSLETERYTDEEKKWLADNFSDDNTLLFIIRKHFLQGELTEAEERELARIKENPVFISIIKKDFVPEINPDANFNQLRDFYSYTDDKELSFVETGIYAMKKWEIMKTYFTQQYRRLLGESIATSEEITLRGLEYSSDKSPENSLYEIGARNNIIRTIESQVLVWKTIANNSVENREKIKEILQANSNK